MMKLIVSALGLILAGSVFFFYTMPAYDNVQTLQAQIDQYNSALDKAQQLQQLKQTLLARYNAFDPNEIGRLQTMLPDGINNVGLILDLDNLAARYGLPLQNVDVSGGDAASTGSQTATGAIGASTQAYQSLTLKFGTSGPYSNFVQFLSDLQSSLRILDIVSLTVSPGAGSSAVIGGNQTGSSAAPSYTYEITLKTYWLK